MNVLQEARTTDLPLLLRRKQVMQLLGINKDGLRALVSGGQVKVRYLRAREDGGRALYVTRSVLDFVRRDAV